MNIFGVVGVTLAALTLGVVLFKYFRPAAYTALVDKAKAEGKNDLAKLDAMVSHVLKLSAHNAHGTVSVESDGTTISVTTLPPTIAADGTVWDWTNLTQTDKNGLVIATGVKESNGSITWSPSAAVLAADQAADDAINTRLDIISGAEAWKAYQARGGYSGMLAAPKGTWSNGLTLQNENYLRSLTGPARHHWAQDVVTASASAGGNGVFGFSSLSTDVASYLMGVAADTGVDFS